ncbi:MULTISPECIES: efflux RND transporter periplasmic adaptor subunit [Sphingomonas]|jgi:RND family efflux transporter MFP subunit|uniref:efflux RND transporter periplasmic adaptor subunit n=1 Tax=Sphingomonas TaxID=13687 RepID=UPI001AE64822
MKALIALTAAFALVGCGAASDETKAEPQSVLVSTVAAKHGALPQTVTAYGSVAPALNGAQTFNEAQPGQLTKLLVTPGATVRRGQALAVFVPAPASRSGYLQAVEALDSARKQRATTAQLLAQQLATQDQLVQADKAVADARTALAALQAEGAGRAVHTLTAPFDGIVTTVSVAQGDRTQAGATLLTVARAGGIVVTAGVDPAERDKVAIGQSASLLRLSGGAALSGHVLRVSQALNAKTRMVDVDITFPAGALLPGEAIQVAIATGQVCGWIVPHRAVVTAGGAPHVFQVTGTKAKAVPVTILLASDAGDVVTGAIDPKRRLIVDGAYQVGDGDTVRWAH